MEVLKTERKLKILASQYTLKMKAFEIYTAGCVGPHCEGCHNQETWSFNQGNEYSKEMFEEIKEKINDFESLIDKIMIFGGEPFDSSHFELEKMLKDLKTLNKEIWVFTRNRLEDLPEFAKEYCDYIKSGRYIKELVTNDNTQYGIELATSNQKIYKKGIDY